MGIFKWFKRLRKLSIANGILMAALIEELHRKGLIDGKRVIIDYEEEMERMEKNGEI